MAPSDQLFQPHIIRMEGYVPGEQPQQDGFIKLNTNENPYPPSPLVLERLQAACNADLRLYPDPKALGVRQRLAKLFGITPDQTLVGNGSDEILNLILRCFVGPGEPVVYPYPTYSYYEKLIQLQNAQTQVIDLNEDYTLPAEVFGTDARITFIANPNSPTGTLIPIHIIEDLAASLKGLLVIDEAYVDFSGPGCINLVDRFANLIVVRTMSKSFSLAGMRLGFCVAAPELIAGLWKAKDHYNINRLSLIAAEAALDDIGHMHANAAAIQTTRSRLITHLATLGFTLPISAANFVLAQINEPPAAYLYQELKKRRILVRYFNQRRLQDCLRITVGTDVEIDTFLKVLEENLPSAC
jgi:histidinol-phosphate aminotransferase